MCKNMIAIQYHALCQSTAIAPWYTMHIMFTTKYCAVGTIMEWYPQWYNGPIITIDVQNIVKPCLISVLIICCHTEVVQFSLRRHSYLLVTLQTIIVFFNLTHDRFKFTN